MEHLLKKIYRDSMHKTNLLSLFTNPHFIIRRALWKQISKQSKEINGFILDFGCGAKPYLDAFKNSTDYIGLDIKESGHSHINSKVDVYYDGFTIPFPDNYFDNVVSFEVFEHVPNPEAMLKELNRVLKPKGTLLVTTPFFYPEHEMPFDFQRFTEPGMKRLLEICEFHPVSIIKTNNNLSSLTQIFCEELFQLHKMQRIPIIKVVVMPVVFLTNILVLLSACVPVIQARSYSNLITIAKSLKS
jgi:SAM-dependent methyltransferase